MNESGVLLDADPLISLVRLLFHLDLLFEHIRQHQVLFALALCIVHLLERGHGSVGCDVLVRDIVQLVVPLDY